MIENHHERRAAFWAFACFFCVLSSYYILRPVRDEIAVRAGVERLQWTFSATFAATLAVIPLFGAASARLRREKLIPLAYAFFIACLLGFSVWLRHSDSRASAISFFVWASVFNIFVVSLVWSFLVDIFTTAQAERLFGIASAGATCGAIAGPGITAALAKLIDLHGLLLISAALLGLALVCVRGLSLWARAYGSSEGSHEGGALGGGIWEGVARTAGSRLLRWMALFILLLSLMATAVYFEQTRLLRASIANSLARTALLARVDLAVNVVGLAVQLLLTKRLLSRLGAPVLLAMLCALNVVGFTALLLRPGLTALLLFQTLRRAADYALIRPAREALFTTVPRRDKYKAKNFLDLVVFRGGDAMSSWLLTLGSSAGLAMLMVIGGAAAFAGIPVSRQLADKRQQLSQVAQVAS